MRIHADDVRTEVDGRTQIAFSCSIGSGVSTWRSSHGPPEPGRDYDVEIDVDEEGVLGQNISILASPRHAMVTSGGRTRIGATIESVDEDGLVYLRLAPDCIVMIDASPGDFEPGQAVELDVPAESVVIVPFGW